MNLPRSLRGAKNVIGPKRYNGKVWLSIYLSLIVAFSTSPLLIQYWQTTSIESAAGTIRLLGASWDLFNTPTIKVLIVPATNLSGWRDSYVVGAIDAVRSWRDCIQEFTERYGYSYLKMLNLESYVLGVNASSMQNYEVVIRWTQRPLNGELASTYVLSDSSRRIQSASILAAIFDGNRQNTLTDNEMVKVVEEELGHALGLGHSNVKGDLMYGSGRPPLNALCHSTLDIYGLAILYNYLDTREFRPSDEAMITLLGTGIPYAYLIATGHQDLH